MTFVFNAMSQKRLVELEDMGLCETQVIKGLIHKVHSLSVACDLLLVPRVERLHSYIGKKLFDLSIRKLRSFDTGRGADAFDGRDFTQRIKPIRRERFQCIPTTLELIDFRYEFNEVLG